VGVSRPACGGAACRARRGSPESGQNGIPVGLWQQNFAIEVWCGAADSIRGFIYDEGGRGWVCGGEASPGRQELLR